MSYGLNIEMHKQVSAFLIKKTYLTFKNLYNTWFLMASPIWKWA